MPGRKTKYNPDTFPILAEGYARHGLIDDEIAANLGISRSTYYDYQNTYPDFLDAITRGKAPVDMIAENNFLKRVNGYEYEEVTTEWKDEPYVDGKDEYDNDIIKHRAAIKSQKKVVKHIPPDVVAGKFWLTNRMAKRWRDKQYLETKNTTTIEIIDLTQLTTKELVSRAKAIKTIDNEPT